MNVPQIAIVDEPVTGRPGEEPIRWSDLRQVRNYQYDSMQAGELLLVLTAAIAAAEDVSVREVPGPPLWETIDIGALEKTLFGDTDTPPSQAVGGVVTFRYHDYVVVVSSDGSIELYEPSDTDDDPTSNGSRTQPST